MMFLLPLNTVGAQPPTLEATGKVFNEHDGIHPLSGRPHDIFVFSISYSDPDDDPPKKGYPRLLIDYTRNGVFNDRDDLNLTMDHSEIGPYDHSLGTDYSREWVFEKPGTYSYAFYVLNEANETDFIGPFDGPVVLQEVEETHQQEWWVEVGLFLMLTFVCSIVCLVVGIGIGQRKREKREMVPIPPSSELEIRRQRRRQKKL